VIDFDELQKARALFREVSKDCWAFRTELDEDFCLGDTIHATAGDCNCPYQKPFDPVDGHGFSELSLDLDGQIQWMEDRKVDEMTLTDALL